MRLVRKIAVIAQYVIVRLFLYHVTKEGTRSLGATGLSTLVSIGKHGELRVFWLRHKSKQRFRNVRRNIFVQNNKQKGAVLGKLRKEVVNILMKSRVVDASLRNQIDCNTVYICERRYKPEDIEISRKFGLEYLGNFVIKPQAKLYR